MKFLSGSLFLGSFALLASATVGACGDSSDSGGDGDVGGDGDGDGDGGAGGPGDGDGDNTPSEAYCESDKACRDLDQICDTTRRVCVDCLETTDCGENEICETGACMAITPCVSSKDCSVDQVCADSVGYCVECVGDNDCGEAQICSGFTCFDTCASDKDCRAADGVCDTGIGICVQCVADADCEETDLCGTGGECVPRVCQADEAFCSGDDLTSCNARGDGFVTSTCEDGCDADAGECEGAGECEVGDEGCECYPNETCNEDLSCLSNFCVDPDGGTGGSDGGGTGGSGSGGSDYCSSIPAFVGTQTVDGAPTEFAGIPALVFDFASSDYQSIVELADDPTTTTTQAEVRVAWDSTALRIHVHVDDAFVAHGVGATYDGDNVQIFVASSAPSTGYYFDDAATQMTIVPAVTVPASYAAEYSESAGSYTGPVPGWASRSVAGGYEVEVEWLWRGGVPTAGSDIGFNIQIGVANTSSGARDYEYGLHLNSALLTSLCADIEAPWCDTRHWCTPTLQ